MPDVLKIVGPQTAVGTSPNTVSNCSLARIINVDPGLVTLTVANNGINVGTITIASNNGEYVQKYPQDTFVSNSTANVLATPIAYTN